MLNQFKSVQKSAKLSIQSSIFYKHFMHSCRVEGEGVKVYWMRTFFFPLSHKVRGFVIATTQVLSFFSPPFSTTVCSMQHCPSWVSRGSQERVLKDGFRLGAKVLRKGRGLDVPHVVGAMSWGFHVKRSWGGRSSCIVDFDWESKFEHRGPKIGQKNYILQEWNV